MTHPGSMLAAKLSIPELSKVSSWFSSLACVDFCGSLFVLSSGLLASVEPAAGG